MSLDLYALTAPLVFAGCGYLLAWGRQRRRDRIELQARFDELGPKKPITKPVMPKPTVFDQDWSDESLNRLLDAIRMEEPPRVIDQEPRWKLEEDGWVLDVTDGAS